MLFIKKYLQATTLIAYCIIFTILERKATDQSANYLTEVKFDYKHKIWST